MCIVQYSYCNVNFKNIHLDTLKAGLILTQHQVSLDLEKEFDRRQQK